MIYTQTDRQTWLHVCVWFTHAHLNYYYSSQSQFGICTCC